MSKFAKFMKANKVVKENEDLRESCSMDVPVTRKPGMFRQKFRTSEYIKKMVAASIVCPDLYDVQLQDSYEVKTPEDLLLAMADDPGEYSELVAFVQKFQGFDVSFADKVDEAKN